MQMRRHFLPCLVLSGLSVAWPAQAAGAQAAAPAAAASAPSARPAIGLPLVQAETLIKEGRFSDALAKVGEAEKAASDATVYERYIVSRSKAAAALGTGQTALAFDALEAAIATRHLAGEAQLRLIESLVRAAYGAKDYPRAARWAARHAEEGGRSPDIARWRIQAQYLGGDVAGAAAALLAQVNADDKAGRATSERDLQWLANAQRKLQDEAGLAQTMERLATHHPKPAYWADLLSRIDRTTLPERLFLDYLRLARATGTLETADQHAALAGLALSAGCAGEARALLDEMAAKNWLGSADVVKLKALHEKARKLAAQDAAAEKRDLASALAAKDGNGLATIGQAAASEGRHDTGIALMEQALARGGLSRPDEVTLRLGEAQALAGRSAAAAKTLAPLARGSDAAAALARLWALYAARSPLSAALAADTTTR